MKIRCLCLFLLLVLTTSTPVFAKSIESANLNLKEITLKSEEVTDTSAPAQILIASDNQATVEDTSALELNKTTTDNKKFLNIFNLKGGVTKAESTTKLETEKTALRQWVDGDYATGKWFGARPLFEDHGVTINSSLLYGPSLKTGGGASGEASGKGYSLFNLSATVDTEKAGLWKGGTFYTLYQRKTGYGLTGPNGAMGDWMAFDNWDLRQINQISECWYQQKLFKDKLRLKVGKQDANIDFGYLNSGWDFMNLAFSVNPTNLMPTYPDQTFGFMAEINPKEWLSIRNGIYSKYNVPFNITEIEFKPFIKGLPGRYSVGAWEMSDSSGMSVSGGIDSTGNTYYNNFNRNFGAYAQFEQMVYKEKQDDENDMQGLVVFGQFGISPSNKNDMSRYVGGGLHYIGPIPKRDKDRAGIAVGSGNFASRLSDVTSQIGDETALEAFYRVQVTPWFYLQPDVQFIMNPSGCYANSVAIGLRSVITF
jgi:porin